MINESSCTLSFQQYRNYRDADELKNLIAGRWRVALLNPGISLQVIPDVCKALLGAESKVLDLELSMTLRTAKELKAWLDELSRQEPLLVKLDLLITFHEDQVGRRAAHLTLDLMEVMAAWPAIRKLKLRVYGENFSRRHVDRFGSYMRHEGEAFVPGKALPVGFPQLRKLSVDTSDTGLTADLLSQFHLTLPAIEVIKKFSGDGSWAKISKPYWTKAAKRV